MQLKLEMIEEIQKGEELNLKEAILKELRKLPPDIMAEINRNHITQVLVLSLIFSLSSVLMSVQQEIVQHYDIFRNALWFRTRIMLGSPTATSTSNAIVPFGGQSSLLPAFSVRYLTPPLHHACLAMGNLLSTGTSACDWTAAVQEENKEEEGRRKLSFNKRKYLQTFFSNTIMHMCSQLSLCYQHQVRRRHGYL